MLSHDILCKAAVAAIALVLAACGSRSETTRSDRIETAIDEGCPVLIPGTDVDVQLLSSRAVYDFEADDEESIGAVRASVRELADSYNEYAKQQPQKLPPQYAEGSADDVGDERDWDKLPLLPHVQAFIENTDRGAKMILEVPDPDLVDELHEHVKADMSRMQTGVCEQPGEKGHSTKGAEGEGAR